MSAPVAIIGLGLMGEVYAQRLIDGKIPVTGFDIDPARRTRLAEIGGCPTSSIAELANSARCIIVAVFNTEQVEDVLENHMLPALGDGSNKIVLCMSTCDPDRIAALADRLDFREKAETILSLFAGKAGDYGLFAATYGLALTHHRRAPVRIVVVGRPDDDRTAGLVKVSTLANGL